MSKRAFLDVLEISKWTKLCFSFHSEIPFPPSCTSLLQLNYLVIVGISTRVDEILGLIPWCREEVAQKMRRGCQSHKHRKKEKERSNITVLSLLFFRGERREDECQLFGRVAIPAI